jgi:hypothetical protein
VDVERGRSITHRLSSITHLSLHIDAYFFVFLHIAMSSFNVERFVAGDPLDWVEAKVLYVLWYYKFRIYWYFHCGMTTTNSVRSTSAVLIGIDVVVVVCTP